MPLMTWDEKYSAGIDEFDAHHKKLFSLINTLHDGILAGKGKEVLGQVLSELVNYTVYHFRAEEGAFQKYGYPEQRQHKAEHDDLTKKAVDLQNKFDSGGIVLNTEVMNFLKGWLNNHILTIDMKYGPFLLSKMSAIGDKPGS